MKVQISLYASLSRFLPAAASGKTCVLEIEPGSSAGDVLNHLGIPRDTVKIVFLNGVHAKPAAVLQDGDRMGVFPPVAGG